MAEIKQVQDFMNFLLGSDSDFYNEFLNNLSDKEREIFLKDNPEFIDIFKEKEK